MPNDYTGLLSGSYWTGIEVTAKPVIVTYSFPTTAPGYNAAINDPNLTPTALASFQAFSATEQQMARDALAEWGDNSGLIFIEVAAGQGDINFQKLDFSGTGYDGAGGIAYRPFGNWDFFSYPYFNSDLDSSGDVFMNSDFAVNYGTLLHEIGHALGLKHPTEVWTNFAADPDVVHNVWAVDDPALTIMSQLPGGTGHLTAIDIQAIQAIYGTQAQDGTQVATWSFNTTKQTLTQTGFATDDAIRGVSVKDVMRGLDGNDRLFGLNGNDVLNGDGGDDTLIGGPGADKLNGDAGNDLLVGGPGAGTLNGGAGDDLLYGDTGKDVLTGGDGNDGFVVNGLGDTVIELLDGGYDTVYTDATYTLTDNVEALVLSGTKKLTGTGNDAANALFAGQGIAVLLGMDGEDYIVGGAKADLLTGGTGADVIYGGAKADKFIFTSYADFSTDVFLDTIGDFSHTDRDKIDLGGIDPDAATAGDQAFAFVGTASFTSDARFQVRYEVQGPDTMVQIDADHDMDADYEIYLYGIHALVAGDFVL